MGRFSSGLHVCYQKVLHLWVCAWREFARQIEQSILDFPIDLVKAPQATLVVDISLTLDDIWANITKVAKHRW